MVQGRVACPGGGSMPGGGQHAGGGGAPIKPGGAAWPRGVACPGEGHAERGSLPRESSMLREAVW
jgi:hypothetical protein